MPKRLSDITHAFERTTDDLEDAEDQMTSAVESARARVDRASRAHRASQDDLLAYLREHQDEIVIANDWGYHYDPHVPGSIRRRPVFWAHHVWVEDRPEMQPATYRVPAETVLANEFAPYIPYESKIVPETTSVEPDD